MRNPLLSRQMVFETVLVLVLLTSLAIGLTSLEGFLEARRQQLWLCQVVQVLSMYSFFVAAVIFCATLTMVGIKFFKNMGSHDAA